MNVLKKKRMEEYILGFFDYFQKVFSSLHLLKVSWSDTPLFLSSLFSRTKNVDDKNNVEIV